MRLTTRGRYAVTALLDLALQTKDQSNAVSLSDIAKRQSISISYLEQLFSKLRKKGIVSSTRGASGGYRLAHPLNEIDVMTIITAVDESVNATKCGGEGNCQGGAMCLTHDLWYALSNHIESYLKNITLAQLLEMENVQSVSDRQRLLDARALSLAGLDFSETAEDVLDASVNGNINTSINNNIETITLVTQGYNEVHPV
ncbi:MAG: Rrf2 family transcriptional regulator [Pseudomonadales bacterium]|nr:MAG: Rrf2 family transcriptional regulator [Pseudomonadales bacterium]